MFKDTDENSTRYEKDIVTRLLKEAEYEAQFKDEPKWNTSSNKRTHVMCVDAARRIETLEASGHRLALELECLLLDCKDNVVVSRWMDTGCEALQAWQDLFPYNGPRLGD
jgi:hypothetical protein